MAPVAIIIGWPSSSSGETGLEVAVVAPSSGKAGGWGVAVVHRHRARLGWGHREKLG